MIFQTVFDQWGADIKAAFANLDPIMVWGWILFFSGVAALFFLIFFTEYKRPERESMKVSLIMVIISAACFGFGLNFILTANGFW